MGNKRPKHRRNNKWNNWTGTVVYGQKTLQTKSSALDRVNVRRLLIALKSYFTSSK